MKKIFISVLVFAMTGILSSCNSVESKAEKFVKETMEATSEWNFSRVSEIEKEAAEYRESLSEEDQKKFDEAGEKATEKYSKEFAKKAEKAGKALEGAFEGLGKLNDAVDEMTSEDTEDSTEE